MVTSEALKVFEDEQLAPFSNWLKKRCVVTEAQVDIYDNKRLLYEISYLIEVIKN